MGDDEKKWKLAIIIINIVTGYLAIFSTICSFIFPVRNINLLANAITVTIILLEIILLKIGKIYEKKVDMDIWDNGKSKREILEEIKPSSENELERARAELRMGIRIMMTSAVLLLLVLYFMKRLAWNLAIAAGLVLVITFIYADYIPHVERYLKDYDAYFVGKKDASSKRGMGRLYFDEWKECGLKNESEFYRNINEKVVHLTDPSEEDKSYIRSVFSIRVDKSDTSLEILSFSMLVVNIMTVTSRLFESVANLFGNIIGQYVFVIISIMATMIFLAASICQMYEYRKECEMIKNIHSALKKNDGDEMAKLYNQIANSSEGSLYIVRGKFVYTQKCIEREHSVSNIPMEYRMLFSHRYYANKTRYKATYLLIVVIFTLVAPDFYSITVKVAMILVFLAILLYFVGLYLLLPQLNKRLVCQECKEIEKEESEEQSIVI